MPLGNGPSTLSALRAMQSLIVTNALIGGVSPFAALSAADAARYGVGRAVFIGRPKDFADAYLPACVLWIPEREEGRQPVELVGMGGRVFDVVEVTVQAFADMRADWYAGEQQILAIRDALWPVALKYVTLGGGASGVTDTEAYEARGLCYEAIAGGEYRCFEMVWQIRQQWSIAGGVTP